LLFQIPKDNGLYKIRHFQTSHDNVTQSITSLIEFRVINSMFRKGYLHLRCTVFISDVYRKSTDMNISEDTPRIASITGESPPFGHRKYSLTSLCYSLFSSRTTDHNNIKIILKWTVTAKNMTFNNHFGIILTTLIIITFCSVWVLWILILSLKIAFNRSQIFYMKK